MQIEKSKVQSTALMTQIRTLLVTFKRAFTLIVTVSRSQTLVTPGPGESTDVSVSLNSIFFNFKLGTRTD